MNEYISREAAIIGLAVTSLIPDQINDAAEALNLVPAADVVEVVRCRECKHRDPEDQKCDCGHGIVWQLPRGDDWFCADGERKDGADNGV